MPSLSLGQLTHLSSKIYAGSLDNEPFRRKTYVSSNRSLASTWYQYDYSRSCNASTDDPCTLEHTEISPYSNREIPSKGVLFLVNRHILNVIFYIRTCCSPTKYTFSCLSVLRARLLPLLCNPLIVLIMTYKNLSLSSRIM